MLKHQLTARSVPAAAAAATQRLVSSPSRTGSAGQPFSSTQQCNAICREVVAFFKLAVSLGEKPKVKVCAHAPLNANGRSRVVSNTQPLINGDAAWRTRDSNQETGG